LSTTTAAALLHAADHGKVLLDGTRGRSTWAPPAQAAEAAVRREVGEHDADALHVEGEAEVVTVRHRDGRAWTVEVTREERADERPESCGKAALPVAAWVAGVPQPAR
jgi:hypothetical protein